MNVQELHNLQEAYLQVYQELDEQGAVQPSLLTKTGKTQNFTKPNRVPFTSSTPVPTRSSAKPTAPKPPKGGFGSKPSGQLKLSLDKPAAKPATQQRSQQYKDVKRLTAKTGGGLMGTTKPTNLEPRAPKPAWKPTAAPAAATAKPTAKPVSSTKPNPYRPGATVRATGPNMDKFPQLQRFANQARKVAEPVSKVAGAIAALRNISPAGVAAAVSAPRPTADATLTGALKRGDYKPKQGPANPDQGLTKSQSFDKAFASARKSGKSGFTWNSKAYSTKMKESFLIKTFGQFMFEAASSQQAYYNDIRARAKKQGASDVEADVIASQSALESGWGKSQSGKNNVLGQKASGREAGSVKSTQEFGGGKMYGTAAKFKDYDSIDANLKDRMNKWSYKTKGSKDVSDAVKRLQIPGGAEIPGSKEKSHGAYATDPDYVSKVSSIARTYGSGAAGASLAAKPTPKPTTTKPTTKGALDTPSPTRVLAKLKGKTGELDKSTNKFSKRDWSQPEGSRYKSYGGK